MNSMSRKIQLRKDRIADKKKKAEEEKYLASLTDEERVEYLKEKEEQGRRTMRMLTSMIVISTGVYSTKVIKRR